MRLNPVFSTVYGLLPVYCLQSAMCIAVAVVYKPANSLQGCGRDACPIEKQDKQLLLNIMKDFDINRFLGVQTPIFCRRWLKAWKIEAVC